ncbi:MAG: hypothetical protein J5983_01175 [Ruminococcus sp.]|nr:hypothetical protein [Ruminococcus sp.]
MGLIEYSDVKYATAVGNIGLKILGIGTSLPDVEKGETNVDAMEKFVDLYEQLGEMMVEYKDLLKLDQESLCKVGLAIKLQDLELTKIFR